MKIKDKSKYSWLNLLLAFLIPFMGLLVLMMIRGFAPFGNNSMLYSDMYHQYYPFFVSYRNAMLSGDSLLWNWDVGMGLNYLGLIAYYLASPLNIFSIFVPDAYLLDFFSLLVPIKLGFAGLFFAIFLRNTFQKNDLSLSFFGAFYGLCAWALAYQWNVMWLDTFALLPLVISGVISLLKNKKFILYTITLFLSVLTNYYIGLFTCIFVVLVFICYEICCWKGFEGFFRDLGQIFLFSLLAIGMTAFLELPAYLALQTTQSGINSFPTGFKLNMADSNTFSGLLRAMIQVAGNANGGLALNFKDHNGLPNIYCGVFTAILGFLYISNKHIKIRERICCVALLLFLNLSFIIRQLDYIWHGFHFTNMIPYRFSFLYSFVLLYMAYKAYLLRRTFKPWQVISSGVLAVAFMFCGAKDADFTYWIYNGVFVGLYFVALIVPFLHRHHKKAETKEEILSIAKTRRDFRVVSTVLILGVMAIEIVLKLLYFGVEYTGVDITNYPEGTTYSKIMIQYMQERSEGDPFYRAEVTQAQTLNDGALNGYHGISAFTSSANVNVTRYAQVMGLAAKNTYNRYCYEEGSPVTNLFLNLRYLVNRRGLDRSNSYFDSVHQYGTTQLLENNAYLPLGFVADSQLLNLDFDTAYQELDSTHGNWNNLAFQNKLFSASTGVEEPVWNMVTGNHLSVAGNGADVDSSATTATRTYKTAAEGGTVTYRYVANEAGFVCLDLYIGLYNSSYNANNRYSVWKNGVELYNDYYSLPAVLGVADVVPGDVVELQIHCNSNEHGLITAHCGILDEEVFRRGYDVLNASTLEITEFENTKITGTVNCNRNGILYTSIPQDGNWVAYVDGKRVDTVLIGNAMVGVPLSEGQHTLTFAYENKSFTTGLIISGVSLLVFVVLCLIFYKKKPDSK